MMYPPYHAMVPLVKKRVEYHYCLQLGRDFRAVVGQPCPDVAAIEKARNAGERINIIPVDEPNDVKWPTWSYPYGEERIVCIAVDKRNTIRRLYVM